MLELPQVTLIAIDNVAHALMARAFEQTMLAVNFADALWFGDAEAERWAPDGVHVVRTAITSRDDVNRIMAKDAGAFIHTSHYLLIQWDSWVLDPLAWTPDFLRFDYIGAPWWYKDGRNVGNGGFSLRSKQLCAAVASLPGIDFSRNEDDELCRNWRPDLERRGVLFAPDPLAYQFSRERTGWERPDSSFGFHGLFNWLKVLGFGPTKERLSLATPYVRSRPEYAELLHMMSEHEAQLALFDHRRASPSGAAQTVAQAPETIPTRLEQRVFPARG